jgi:hypothetical protein
MPLIMKRFIDVLQMPLSSSPYFIVDITKKYVPVVASAVATFQIWTNDSSHYRQAKFQNKDNIQVLSIGMFMPENFAFTSIDAPVYDNTLGPPSAPNIDDAFTALVTVLPFLSGFIYKWDGANWLDLDYYFPSPVVSLGVTNTEGGILTPLPGFGSSQSSSFALPFPNYELALDLYCDIAGIYLNDEYYMQGTLATPFVSMVGVPSDLDGRTMRIIPWVKIAHTCSLEPDPLP